jgi:hypothetical protein
MMCVENINATNLMLMQQTCHLNQSSRTDIILGSNRSMKDGEEKIPRANEMANYKRNDMWQSQGK